MHCNLKQEKQVPILAHEGQPLEHFTAIELLGAYSHGCLGHDSLFGELEPVVGLS